MRFLRHLARRSETVIDDLRSHRGRRGACQNTRSTPPTENVPFSIVLDLGPFVIIDGDGFTIYRASFLMHFSKVIHQFC